MPNRTVQILGYGYGSVTCSANVSYNGATVFSGTIPTLNQPQILLTHGEQVVICTFEIDMAATGTFPLTINLTGGHAAFIEWVSSNYMPVPNPVYSASDWAIIQNPNSTVAQKLSVFESLATPPLSEADITVLEQGHLSPEAQAVLATHGISRFLSSGGTYESIAPAQAKSNVIINGATVAPGSTPPGEWGWVVPITSGTGTLSCDLNVVQGLA